MQWTRNFNPCQSQGRACTCNDGYGGQYCESTFRVLLAVCDNTSTVREYVKCYHEAAEDNKCSPWYVHV